MTDKNVTPGKAKNPPAPPFVKGGTKGGFIDPGFRPTPAATTALIFRVLVGGVLLYAGYMKAVGPAAEFAASIEGYKLLPPMMITPLSQVMPWIEMWIGLFLITGYYTRFAAGGAMLLFLTFIFALGSALVRHLNLYSCGCFGYDSYSPQHTIIGDVILLLFSLALLLKFHQNPYLTLDNWIDKP